MRLLHAIGADMRFQMKQGFYLVYVIITVMYLLILSFIPEGALPTVVPLVVFSDPSVLGLFFIGGIIMLEKMQGVLSVVVITPLRSSEYLLSKVISLTIIAVLAGCAITLLSFHGKVNWILAVLSMVLTSGFFTLCGIMISAGCQSVNQYMLKMVPYMLLLVLPCFSLIGFPFSWLFTLIPSVAAVRLLLGAFTDIKVVESIGLLLYLTGMTYLCFRLTLRVFEKKIVYQD